MNRGEIIVRPHSGGYVVRRIWLDGREEDLAWFSQYRDADLRRVAERLRMTLETPCAR